MSEWEKIKIGDSVNIQRGYAFKSKDYCDKGTFVLRVSNLNSSYSVSAENAVFVPESFLQEYKQYLVEEGDILLVMVGATTGKIARVPKLVLPALLNQNLWNLKPDPILDKKFFFYMIQREIEGFLSRKNGSAREFLKQSDFLELEIVCPSVSKQQKIAAILSTVDKAIEKTEAIIEQTEEVKKGLMQQLLTKGIGHTKFKKAEIGEIPEEWEVVMMSEVIELISGQSSSSNEVNYEGKGIVYVTGPEQWNGYHIEETKWVEKPRKIAKENSIFITVKGSGVGTIFLGGYYAIGRDVMSIVPLENINKDYLYYLALYQAQKIVYNKVGIVPGISRGDILEFKFGLPKIEEQVRISKVLTSWDKKLTIEKNKRLTLRELKKGLMQSLLTGKVRVEVSEDEVIQA
ncbi:restriction endonuclease subunit S [Bacillus wiedmannii]|uniref:restriction endonuclease subunit S n=1 Tax=Bacillus wiedmannii TaxID=1890302 RepID=UPI000BF2A452|nr:restriction endonuclease subunit S [Bacillus wiedmannii]PFY96961.1 hypothetical protein COL57_15800 [Bacillus wiedmannii]